jgi:CHASE2 domain-containing sensor protein
MKKFLLDCFFASVFVFLILYGIQFVTQLNLFNAFDPLSQALGDMELSDIAFSQLREDPPIDTNIVIVNIGNLSRAGIGQQIATLSQFNPKVIGLDIIFSCDWLQDSLQCPQAYDTLENLVFASAVAGFKNMVMGEKLQQTDSLVKAVGDTDQYDSIEHTYPTLLQHAYEGYVNLETEAAHQEDLKSCRTFNPKFKLIDGREELAFAVRMAMLYDSVKTQKFLDRDNHSEIINYRGNIIDWHGASNFAGRYPVLDYDQALDTSSFVPGMIRDKIVIMGFLGADLRDTSWDDKFFTPLNKAYAGKSRPDMYGVVVHANIVSMILNEDYINSLPDWVEYAVAFVFVFFNVALFIWIDKKLPLWTDPLTLLVQLVQVILLTILMIEFLALFDFKLNITVTLAAVALVGTCFDLYKAIVRRFFVWVYTDVLNVH